MVSRLTSKAAAAIIAVAAFSPTTSYALFGDDEARRAIIELREQVAKLEKNASDNSLRQVEKNDYLLQEIAKLRGQVEVLSHQLSTQEQRQKDFYLDLDTRLRKLEPQQVSIGDKQFTVQADEQKAYDAALKQFQDGNFKGAGSAFYGFLTKYPASGFAAPARFWLGNAWYAQGNCKNAIISHQELIKQFPDDANAPEALLNIANCQLELKDKPAARKTLQTLGDKYPQSAAAKKGKELAAQAK